MRVFLYMEDNGIDLPMKDILENPEFREELIEGGGRKTVPCLRIETPEGIQWMYESLDIIDYLESVFKSG